jgi:hypothetical protein
VSSSRIDPLTPTLYFFPVAQRGTTSQLLKAGNSPVVDTVGSRSNFKLLYSLVQFTDQIGHITTPKGLYDSTVIPKRAITSTPSGFRKACLRRTPQERAARAR